MKLVDILNGPKPSLSFEVFPPKTSDTFESVQKAVTEIAALKPSYMSVTYGAGGGTSEYTVQIAEDLLRQGIPPLAHLTCISSNKESVHRMLTKLKQSGIQNILALRGDIPQGQTMDNPTYHHASDLIEEIKRFDADFCIGGACYPENHPESANAQEDIENLKKKVVAGCQFLTTQMFFDNNILYNFMYRALRAGVNVPVVAGIMPVTNASQIKRICAISGNQLSQQFLRIVDRYGHDPLSMKQAGIAFATQQIVDLFANGINAVHVYSMNKPDVAKAIQNNVCHLVQ